MSIFNIQLNPHQLPQNLLDYSFLPPQAYNYLKQIFTRSMFQQYQMAYFVYYKSDSDSEEFSDSDKCFECKYCGRVFERYMIYERHMKYHDPNYPTTMVVNSVKQTRPRKYPIFKLPYYPDPLKPLFCYFCNYSFDDYLYLKQHECKLPLLPSYQCPKCQETYFTPETIVRHVRSHEDLEYSCSMCYITFKKRRYWKYHMQTHEYNSGRTCQKKHNPPELRGLPDYPPNLSFAVSKK